MAFTRGQRLRLDERGVTTRLRAGIGVDPADRFTVVVAGLGPDDRLVDAAFLLSEHQPRSFEGSVALQGGRRGATFDLVCELGRIPASVTTVRIALVALERWSADSLTSGWLELEIDGPETRWSFSGHDMAGERSIIVADLYRKDGGWRLVLQAGGYRGGMSEFLERIGGPDRLPGARTAPPPARPRPASVLPPPPAPRRSERSPRLPPPPDRPVPPDRSRTPAPAPAPRSGRPSVGDRPARPDLHGGRRPAPGKAGLTWRERVVSPKVARAAMAPAALGLGAGGAAAGAVGGLLLLGPPGAVIGAVALGAAGWAGKVSRAIPPRVATDHIDPYALREPWRHFVADALGAKALFDAQLGRVREGPIRDRLVLMGERMQTAVDECWTIARRGESLVEARLAIDDHAVKAEMSAAEGQVTGVIAEGSTQAAVLEALRSQLRTADRLDGIIDETYDRLLLLDARLDDTVARAIELTVSASDLGAYDGLGDDVDDVVEELETLRQALEEMHASGRTGADPAP